MDSQSVVPSVSATATRTGYFDTIIDTATGDLEIGVMAVGLDGLVTSITMHCDVNNQANCLPSLNCPVCLDIGKIQGSLDLPAKIYTTVDSNIVSEVTRGNYYILVSTTANPNGELRGSGQSQSTTPPTHVVNMMGGGSSAAAKGYITLSNNNRIQLKMRHTIPSASTSSVGYYVGGWGSNVTTQASWSNLAFTAQYQVVTQTSLNAAALLSLEMFELSVRMTSLGNADVLTGNVYPIDFAPVDMALVPGQMGAAVWPAGIRAYDQGKLTIAAALHNQSIGNEIWVDVPEGFEFDSGAATTAIYPVGVSMPEAVVVTGNQVQLRWSNATVPFMYGGTTFSITLTNVALPNNCIPKEYKLRTEKCEIHDVLNAGVLMKRICAPHNPMDVNDLAATPMTGAPVGCSRHGCDGCKFLYTSPADNSSVYSCEHAGVTVMRLNVSLTEACTFY